MKSIITSGIFILTILLLTSCAPYNGVNEQAEENNDVAISISYSSKTEFAKVADHAVAIVTAKDISHPMKVPLSIRENKISGIIGNIPAGKKRYITVNIYNKESSLIYMGRTIVTVESNEVTKAIIDLYKTDNTGSIEIGGEVIEHNNSDYFSISEIFEIIETVTAKNNKDLDDVIKIIKKEKTLFGIKWKKTQEKEVYAIIIDAVKQAEDSDNTSKKYFTTKEIIAIVKEIATKEKKDYDDAYYILKVEKNLFEHKWKRTQEKEVREIILDAVKRAFDDDGHKYFTKNIIIMMIKNTAAKEKKNYEDALRILQSEKKLFEQRWKVTQEQEVNAIILDAVKRAKDESEVNLLFEEIMAIIKEVTVKEKKDFDDVLRILNNEKKLFGKKWKISQKKEVYAIVLDAVLRAKDADNNSNDYFNIKEIIAMVKEIAEEEKKDYDDVYYILKVEQKLFEHKWKRTQEKEVRAIILDAAKRAHDDDGHKYFTKNIILRMINNIAVTEKKNYEDALRILQDEKKLFEHRWKVTQEKEVNAIILDAVKRAKDESEVNLLFEEILEIIKEVTANEKKDYDDVIRILNKEQKLFGKKWKRSQEQEVYNIVLDAVLRAEDDHNTIVYLTIDEINAIVRKVADLEKKDLTDLFRVLKEENKLFTKKWELSETNLVIDLVEDAATRAKDADPSEYYTDQELLDLIKKHADFEKKDFDDAVRIIKDEKKLFGKNWKKTFEKEVLFIIIDAVRRAKDDDTHLNGYYSEKELLNLVDEVARGEKKYYDDALRILKDEKKLFEHTWQRFQKNEVLIIILDAVKRAKDIS